MRRIKVAMAMVFALVSVGMSADSIIIKLKSSSLGLSSHSNGPSAFLAVKGLQASKAFSLKKSLESSKPNKSSKLSSSSHSSAFILANYEGDDLDSLVSLLNAHADVAYAEINHKLEIQATLASNDPLHLSPEIYRQKQVSNVANTDDAENTVPVIVAVLDTGIDKSHPDLEQNIWHNASEVANGLDDDGNGYVDDLVAWDFYDYASNGGDNDVSDGHGHGTHVAGIISAVADNNIGVAGISSKSKIMPVKFLNEKGMGSQAEAAMAIHYAVNNGAKIINCSWGYFYETQTLRDAIAYATEQGVLVVAAAGNYDWDRPQYPASYDNVVGVAALTDANKRAGFSNYGNYIDIAAPGVGIVSTYKNHSYKAMSGTSQAAPMVSALGALMLAAEPGLNPLDLQNLMYASADDILYPENNADEHSGWDPYTGSGKLNIARSLNGSDPVPGVPQKELSGLIAGLNNYPNPVRSSSTVIRYELSNFYRTSLRLYNLIGQLQREIIFEMGDDGAKKGQNNIEFNLEDDLGNELANGTYIYLLTVHANNGRQMAKAKMMILR
jgi:subtilisin family serine protease